MFSVIKKSFAGMKQFKLPQDSKPTSACLNFRTHGHSVTCFVVYITVKLCWPCLSSNKKT